MNAATPKRIQKHLIDRDDIMYYDTGLQRTYVSVYNGTDNEVFFAVHIWGENESGETDSVTFYYESLTAVELAMRMVMHDLRKWRVLKNGR